MTEVCSYGLYSYGIVAVLGDDRGDLTSTEGLYIDGHGYRRLQR